MKIDPNTESQRLAALKSLNILDSLPEKEYDQITKLVASICDTPIALISLLDENRQWFKSKIGIDHCETDKDYSFCNLAIQAEDEIMEVSDARLDERFTHNPLVEGEDQVIFYAGVPLRNKDGYALGTLCVIDHQPRTLSQKQKEGLLFLANQVIKLFELHFINRGLKKTQKQLKEKNAQLRNFAGVVSHDMKMPLANMIVTIDVLKAKYKDKLDESGLEYLNNLKKSSFQLSDYISNILTHYESDSITSNDESLEKFDVHSLVEDIVEMMDIGDDCDIRFPEESIEIYTNRVALEQILLNLIGNSLKYNDKPKIEIDIDFQKEPHFYRFYVKDNGIGIPEDKQKEIFNLFSTLAVNDRKGNKGNGIGLSTVKKMIHNLGGKISVSSEEGQGTTFEFTIERTKKLN
ncbi:GAF domain-containing sensor histidine kinase [Psychroflexus sp. YR1-1]|uniref:histidine kinase n=1 Tax=Psychroflexus aurantiacus TaxID=2709310 RepID=A0A6B3R5D8_9FLAO|nr:GAF domain-containing sensor histidine kinase [Psychroflexus aurantiacus]NEV94225.1 GAF domain-containing sensor histidine kinase [Psychroflexus aurantiacus]